MLQITIRHLDKLQCTQAKYGQRYLMNLKAFGDSKHARISQALTILLVVLVLILITLLAAYVYLKKDSVRQRLSPLFEAVSRKVQYTTIESQEVWVSDASKGIFSRLHKVVNRKQKNFVLWSHDFYEFSMKRVSGIYYVRYIWLDVFFLFAITQFYETEVLFLIRQEFFFHTWYVCNEFWITSEVYEKMLFSLQNIFSIN